MKNKNLEILNSLFQNTTLAISSLSAIIPKTKDAKLKGELQAQFDKYHQQNEEIRKQIYAQNADPRDISMLTKKSVNLNIGMSTLINKSSGHIAEMMIQGTNMGVIDINKLLNQATVDENIKQQNILSSEQQYIDKLKSFL